MNQILARFVIYANWKGGERDCYVETCHCPIRRPKSQVVAVHVPRLLVCRLHSMPILSGQGSDRRQPEDDSFKVMSSSAATSRDDGGGGVQGGGNGLAKSGPQSPPNPRQLLSRLAQAEAAVRLQQQQTPPKLSSLGEPSSPFPLSQLASSPLGSPGRDHILLNGKRVSSSITTMSSCSATSALAAAISSTKTSSITSQDGVLVGAHLKTVSTKISSSISSSSSHVVVKEEEDRGSPSSLVSPSLTIDERSDKENEEDRQKGSSRQDGDNNKKVQNNNTSSYAPGGGRLKFFKGEWVFAPVLTEAHVVHY